MSIDNENIIVYGQDFIIEKVESLLNNLKNGKGGFLLIEGDIGTGKTHILNFLEKYANNKGKDFKVVQTETQVPVANFKIGTLQPFQPFIIVLDELGKQESGSKIQFAANVGLTLLASMPVVGEVAYAYKEISKDLKQFKQDNLKNKTNESQAIYKVFIEKLNKVRKDKKVVVLMDNMHWSDSQSIEFLHAFIDNDYKDPILIICTYNDVILKSQAMPWMTIVQKLANKNNQQIISLKSLSIDNIKTMSKQYFNNYKQNTEFEEWIFKKSEGNPGIITEYLKFFSKNSPFDDSGNLVTNFKDNEFLPGTWSAVFSLQIEKLTDEDKHILTVCAGEGIEFTANIVSKLLSLDILETIKKLRNIQNKSGLIKSQGPQNKYGIKTTTYKFSQVFYHSFFENLLEYEERLELHSKISELLKIQFSNTLDEDIKSQIAPYLAAHSIEGGDFDTAKEALYNAAQISSNLGGDEYLESIKSTIQNLDPKALNLINSIDNLKVLKNFAGENTNNLTTNYVSDGFSDIIIDFKNIRKSVVNDIINDDIQIAESKLKMYVEQYKDHFNNDELVQLYSLLSKIYIDLKMLPESLSILKNAENIISNNVSKNTIALFNNSFALYFFNMGDIDNSLFYLYKNEELIPFMGADTKILTATLISQISKQTSQEKYKKYKNAALKLIEELNYDTLRNEVSNY